MQPQKSIMIAMTEISARYTGVFNRFTASSERIHRILDTNDVLAMPSHAFPQMFSEDEDQSLNLAMDKAVLSANSLTADDLVQMGIDPNTQLMIKAYCVATNETIQSREIVLEKQQTEQPKLREAGPKFLSDRWSVPRKDLVFFTVHTGSDLWKFVRDSKFVTGEFNPSEIIACPAMATDYWMDMAKEVMRCAEQFFTAEDLNGAKLSVWQWREQGSNELLHERNFGEKAIVLKTIAPTQSAPTEQEDSYASIPNAGAFESKYLVKELSAAEVMAGIVRLFEDPDAEDHAQHNHNLRTVQWDLVLKGSVTSNVRKAVKEIMGNKGWTVEFATSESNTTDMSIYAVIKG